MNLSRSFLIGRMFVILESCVLLGRAREPLDRQSTLHVRCLSPAREFKTRRARFNVDRWIQNQRPTVDDHARVRARVSPVGLGHPMQDRRRSFAHIVIGFSISQLILLQQHQVHS